MGRRTAGPPGATNAARTWRARVCVVVGVACVLFALVAPSAGAAYARLSAEAGCDRVVEWSASASNEGTEDERTNTDVVVEYRGTGDDKESWIATGRGVFEPDNDFSFGGSFELPDDADAVELRVSPRADWGPGADGDAPGEPRFATAAVPEACATQSLDLDVREDCASGGAQVELTNLGSDAETAEVVVDRVAVRRLTLEGRASESLLVPLLDGRDTRIEVRNGDVELADRTFRGECDRVGPSAVVIERCSARQAVVLAGTDDGDTHTVQTRVDGVIVNRSEVTSARELQRTLELPSDGAVDVEIDIDGTVVAEGPVGGCDAPVAGLVHCGGSDRPVCGAVAGASEVPAPPPPPESLNIEVTDSALPLTGPWERGIVLALGGVLLVAGGLAVLGHERRRPRPSVVADSLAPYRQRWWNDSSGS